MRTAWQSQKTVTAYFPREKLLLFGLAGQRCSIDSRPGDAWCRIPSGSGLARWKWQQDSLVGFVTGGAGGINATKVDMSIGKSGGDVPPSHWHPRYRELLATKTKQGEWMDNSLMQKMDNISLEATSWVLYGGAPRVRSINQRGHDRAGCRAV